MNLNFIELLTILQFSLLQYKIALVATIIIKPQAI